MFSSSPALSAFLAALFVSLLSFSGALSLLLSRRILRLLIPFLVALSAGAMMGGAFLHLLPEAISGFSPESMSPFLMLIGGFSVFFLLERFVFWHHCHSTDHCSIHSFGYMNLLGDGLHNFLDGVVLAAAFLVDPLAGMGVTTAIIIHEIPQELSDFGVLIHAGFSPKKALLLNLFVALFALLGVAFGLFWSDVFQGVESYFLAFSAGGFLYISASDLVPQLHREKDIWRATLSFFVFLGGIALMVASRVFFG